MTPQEQREEAASRIRELLALYREACWRRREVVAVNEAWEAVASSRDAAESLPPVVKTLTVGLIVEVMPGVWPRSLRYDGGVVQYNTVWWIRRLNRNGSPGRGSIYGASPGHILRVLPPDDPLVKRHERGKVEQALKGTP